MTGTVLLTATTAGGAVQVVFQRSPEGAGLWTTIGTDSSAPFTARYASVDCPAESLARFRSRSRSKCWSWRAWVNSCESVTLSAAEIVPPRDTTTSSPVSGSRAITIPAVM